MWRKVISAAAVIVFCVLIWLFIQWRGTPPPPPDIPIPMASSPGR